MTTRRNMILGAGCLAAAGAAYGLHPRRRLTLLSEGKLADVVPLTLDGWSAENVDSLVQPKTEGELAATLYSEMVGRIYHEASTGNAIMMLIAYGDTQSDLLQLHRPESCYPAVGFRLVSSEPARLPLLGGGSLPIRKVVAEASSRRENILYWARLGEYLPDSAGEQRKVRLKTAMAGLIPDGALVRFSMIDSDAENSFKILENFVPKLLASIAPKSRAALVGTELAKQAWV
jgi:EpsI family protein